MAVEYRQAYLVSYGAGFYLWELALGLDTLIEVAKGAKLHNHEDLIGELVGFVVLDNVRMI